MKKPQNAAKSSSTPQAHSESEMSVHALTQNDALVGEVQSFVAKRAELAKKVAEEIKVTERKLAELKKTAAILSPDSAAGAAKERMPRQEKPKKTPRQGKPKAPRREEKPPADSAPETSQAVAE